MRKLVDRRTSSLLSPFWFLSIPEVKTKTTSWIIKIHQSPLYVQILDTDIGDLGECVQAPIARHFAPNVCSALAPPGACSQAIRRFSLLQKEKCPVAELMIITLWSTNLAAWTPSQVVLSLIRILSLLIPASSYSFINFFALSIEPSTSNDNL